MIKFFKEIKNMDFENSLVYSLEEKSFDYEPIFQTEYSIMIGKGYNGLDVVLDTMEVKGITGFNPYYNWIKTVIKPPKYRKGLLKVSVDNALKGTGEQYVDNWNTYYDRKNGWICMSEKLSGIELEFEGIEFAKNTIAIINNFSLIALFLKPDFLEK